jgi:hypothetical protein
MDHIVAYSLALPGDEPRPDLIWQFAASVNTLRRHNREIPIVLFVYGALPQELARVCHDHRVMVHDQGPYERRLASLTQNGWPALSQYPLLHRFLNFSELGALGVKQMLSCDCDTIFFADVEKLFDTYLTADVVAREEVHSRRSRYGADPTFIDETLLARIAAHERIAIIPPFNLGVVLFNNGVWQHLERLASRFIDYAWRLVVGMTILPSQASPYGLFRGLAQAQAHATDNDMARALPYPSANHWILDEVALWLTLGHVEGVRTADFSVDDVAENGEFANVHRGTGEWVMCHYYTQNMRLISEWLQSPARSS